MSDLAVQTTCCTCGDLCEVLRGSDSDEAITDAQCAPCIGNALTKRTTEAGMTSKSVKFKICDEGHKYNATDYTACPKCKAEKEAKAAAVAPTDPAPATVVPEGEDAATEVPTTDINGDPTPTNGTPSWDAFAGEHGETDKARIEREKGAPQAPKPRRERRTLLCEMALDDLINKRAEHLEKGDELEKLERLFDVNEEAHRDAKKALQAKIDVAKDQERDLRHVVKSAKIEKLIWCTTELRGSNAYVIREDTAEIIEERAATRDELQHDLPFPDEHVNPAPVSSETDTSTASEETPEPTNQATAALERGAKKKAGKAKAKKSRRAATAES